MVINTIINIIHLCQIYAACNTSVTETFWPLSRRQRERDVTLHFMSRQDVRGSSGPHDVYRLSAWNKLRVLHVMSEGVTG